MLLLYGCWLPIIHIMLHPDIELVQLTANVICCLTYMGPLNLTCTQTDFGSLSCFILYMTHNLAPDELVQSAHACLDDHGMQNVAKDMLIL